MDDKKAQEFEALWDKLSFSVNDSDLDLDTWHDIGACYIKAIPKQERIWVVARPTEGAQFHYLALNPAAAFHVANAILAEGERAGWYSGVSESGHGAPRTVQ